MCGEIDEQVLVGQELLERLQAIAKRLSLDMDTGDATPADLLDPSDRAAFMDGVFRDGLARAMGQVAFAGDETAIDALALHSIALARLAGFLAGQLPPEADLFRALIEAVTSGHAEQREMTSAMFNDHDHDHHHRDRGDHPPDRSPEHEHG